MVIGISLLRISLPVFVAEQHGLLKKHGIDAEVRRYDTAQPLADELCASRDARLGGGDAPARARLDSA